MSNIEEKCKAKGVRLTDQRRVIAKVMSDSKETYGSKDHPDVDELHKRVSSLDKNISIATVYRTVKLFEEAGIIERHDFKEGKARYEPLTEEHHDHLIDINTGEIIEFVNEDIEKLQKKTNKIVQIVCINEHLRKSFYMFFCCIKSISNKNTLIL